MSSSSNLEIVVSMREIVADLVMFVIDDDDDDDDVSASRTLRLREEREACFLAYSSRRCTCIVDSGNIASDR